MNRESATAALPTAPSPDWREGGPELPDPPPPGADDRTKAAELLDLLRAGGFKVTARDGKVYVEPRSELTPGTCEQVRRLKAGLLEVLAEERWTRCDPAEGCGGWVDPEFAGELPVGTCRAICPLRRRKPR